MLNLQFLAFEVLMVALVLVCLRHAYQDGIQSILRLLAGIFFGVMLEWATIKQLDAYEYGHFLIMIDNIPISIGMGWGVILYGAMLFSNHCNIPEFFRPLIDALLALNIDIAMDAIAIRIGMWDWGQGLNHEYFGVPFDNFWAWFWVIFSFSMSFRLLNRLPKPWSTYIAPLASIPIGVIGVLITNRIIVSYVPQGYDWVATLVVIFSALALIFSQKPTFKTGPLHPIAVWVPLGFHAYFLMVGLVSGTIFDSWIIFAASILMAALSYFLHRSRHHNIEQKA